MTIKVLFQDEHYIIVEKPSGMVVHPIGNIRSEEECLMTALKAQTDLYLYPVHRLDRPVSGIVIFALSKEATKGLKDIWHKEEFIKEYTLLCKGLVKDSGRFNFPLRHKKGFLQNCVTVYQTLDRFNEQASLCSVLIRTGRRHQIRRHFSRSMVNLIGDRKHGLSSVNEYFKENYGLERIFLHSHHISFPHPITGETIEIHSKLPEELQQILTEMKNTPPDFKHLLKSPEALKGNEAR